jgi:hypothetical protein
VQHHGKGASQRITDVLATSLRQIRGGGVVSRKTKLIVDELIAAFIARPETFRIGEHTVDDQQTRYQYWIANSRFNGGVYHPYSMKFGMWQSWRFHRAVDSLKTYQAIRALRAQPPAGKVKHD